MADNKVVNKKKEKAENTDIQRLVLARLDLLPSNIKISIGSNGEFTKEEMIDHLERNDEVGKKFAEIHLSYLRAMKEGVFYE